MYIVADIGGTKIRVAAIEGSTLGEPIKIATPTNPQEGIAALVELVRSCARGERIEGFAGCIAGNVDSQGILSDAHNLHAWEGTNVTETISQTLNAPVILVNDAGLAGLGEAIYGAGRGVNSVAYVTVSTGVGGGLIREGRIVEAGGIASMPIDGVSIENIISGTAVKKRFGTDPKNLSSLREREQLADVLAQGLTILYDRWTPQIFVIGGSMIVGQNPIPLARVSETLRALAGKDAPQIKMAELGDNGGLYGGLALLKQRP